MTISGIAPKLSASSATIACQFGGHKLALDLRAPRGTFFRISTVAGAGAERRLWAISTVPWNMGMGLANTLSISSRSRQMHAPTMSTMASTAPISWKVCCRCRCHGQIFASASPSLRKMAVIDLGSIRSEKVRSIIRLIS